MLRRHIKGRGISDPRVLDAMAAVPREEFVPPDLTHHAYRDGPLPIGEGQTISQPYVVAAMAEAAELKTGDRVLEVGTGSGYAAAVFSRIADVVYTMERHASLADLARERLGALGFGNVHVGHGDGTRGWSDHAPYDAIVVAAGGRSVPEALREQLALGGRLLMPVGRARAGQSLVRERRRESGAFTREELGTVRFVPLISDVPARSRVHELPFGLARDGVPKYSSPMDEQNLLLEEMTWPEVEGLLAAGFTSVVIAAGAVEQHGPHLPLLVDAARGDRLAVEVARRLGNTLVAPTIRVGCSEHHMGFPGTISLRGSTLKAICLDYTASLARHGFRTICFVPSHGGNFAPLAGMLDELRASAGPGCDVRAYTDLHGFVALWKGAVAEVAPGLVDRVGGHADIAESSEMLCIRPGLVRGELAAPGHVADFDEALAERIFRDGFRAVTPNGVLGDARGMSREIGERCIARAAEGIAAALRDAP